MLTLEMLKNAFDRNFAPPFLEKGHVVARFVKGPKKKTLEIKIGRRDIWLTVDGRVSGAGTDTTCQP